MRLYRNLYLLPKCLGATPSAAAAPTQFHSASRQQQPLLIRLDAFRGSSLFSSAAPSSGTQPTMTKFQAFEVVQKLTEPERQALAEALKQFDTDRGKIIKGELSAHRWTSTVLQSPDDNGYEAARPERTIIGGSAAKMESTVVDASKADKSTTNTPSKNDLMTLMLVNAVPFLGFGFLDNFFMIIAGDYIEHTLGMFMCITTMAAAGLGNTISDVMGLGLAHYVESFCTFLGLRPPKLSPEQLAGPACRRVSSYGRALGIAIGCLLGMCPLLFINKKSANEAAEETTTAAVVVTPKAA